MVLTDRDVDADEPLTAEAIARDLEARGFDADAARFVAERHVGPSKPLHEKTVEEALAAASDHMPRAGTGPDLDRVEDISVSGEWGPVPVRLYARGDAQGAPVLVWLHGGGWLFGDLETADTVCRYLAAEAGVIVISVDYRKAPEYQFPVAVEECFLVVAWAAAHAAEIGGDAARLAVGGDSAGGTMAAAVCLMARDRGAPSIAFQLLVNPAPDSDYDRPSMHENAFFPMGVPADIQWHADKYLRNAQDLLDERAMPAVAASHESLPRAFILTAEFDILRDGGEAYAETLAAASVPVRAKRYDGVGHGWFNMVSILGRSREAMNDAVAELGDALGGASS